MDLIKGLAFAFPGLAARYLEKRARYELAQKRYYEASEFTNYRPARGGQHSGDMNMERAGTKLRGLSRYLEENHDLAVGVIDDLVNNVVGAGVAIEPLVRDREGALHDDANKVLREAWEVWSEFPESTGELGFESLERMVARSIFRDGEIFVQKIGRASFRYRTPIPFVLDLIEPDLVPFDLSDESKGIVHGVERNGWGSPVAYHILKDHPGNRLYRPILGAGDTVRVSAQRIEHLKFSRRLKQARGVPVLHAAMNRLRDLADYEESERIAARVAASIALAIQRNAEYQGSKTDNNQRSLEMQAGAIYELLPGETMSTVGSDRPNTGLADFRASMVRAIASGTGTRYSSIARDYNGTYSAQRQELTEATTGYRALFGYLRNKFYRPVYMRWVEQAVLSGAVRLPRGVDPASMFRADFRPPALPWIDPAKEAAAWEKLISTQLESRAEIARQRGRDPAKVREEIEAEKASGAYDPVSPQPAAADEGDGQADDAETAGADDDRVINLGVFNA